MHIPARSVSRRYIVLLLSAPLLFGGCVAQTPVSPSVTAPSAVERPPLDKNELGTWRYYYANQFKLYADNALEPVDYYPESAREAHGLEQAKWMTEQLAATKKQRQRETTYARLGFILLGFAGYGAYALVTRD